MTGSRTALVALLVLLLGGVGAAAWLYQSVVRFAKEPCGDAREKVVELARGAGPRAVAAKLEAAGVVCDARRFYWLVRLRGATSRIQAGEYAFDGPQTPKAVLAKIVSGQVRTYAFTIPEGLRIDEVAAIVEKSGLARAEEIVRLARDPAFARPLVAQDSLEGYLFPSTYRFPKSAGAATILKRMVSEALSAIARAEARRAPGVTLTRHQLVTLASIVEKETGAAEERPRISCVFHNRLHKRMRLETDPTVIYSKILRTGSFDGNITRQDLEAPHPYNTYTMAGLPPGPIASPGEAALLAAAAPVACDDLFFVSRNDGTHEFCPDLACHQAAVQKWQIEYFRKKRAGN